MTARWEAVQKLQGVMYDRRGVPVPRTPTELLDAIGFDAMQGRIAELTVERDRLLDAGEAMRLRLEAEITQLRAAVALNGKGLHVLAVIERADAAELEVARLTPWAEWARDHKEKADEAEARVEMLEGKLTTAELAASGAQQLRELAEARVALAQRIIDAYATFTGLSIDDLPPFALKRMLAEWSQ